MRSEEHNRKIGEAQRNKPRFYARGKNNYNSKGSILQLDLDGNVMNEFSGLSELLDNGFSKDVYYAISGRQKTHRGFRWKWKEESLSFDK